MQHDIHPKHVSNENKLLQILSEHKKQFIDSNEDNDIIEFMDANGSKILNYFDCYLLKQKEKESENYAQQFYNKLAHKCDIETCKSIERDVKNQMHSESDAYHQLIDTIHIEIYHGLEKGFRLTQAEKNRILALKQKDDNNNNNNEDVLRDKEQQMLHEIVAIKRLKYENLTNKYRKNDAKSNKMSKFVTKIATQRTLAMREEIIKHLMMSGMNTQKMNIFIDTLIEEKYDTDCIENDAFIALKSKSKTHLLNCNLYRMLNEDETYFYQIARYLFNKDVHSKVYSHGIRFFYWPFYKDIKENETVKIYENPNNRHQAYWSDPGNAGYIICDWFIEPRYKDMKSEILQNKIYSLTASQWIALKTEANEKLNIDFCRKLTANKYFIKAYDVEEVELKHVIALLLYTNYTDLCTAFAATLRRKNIYETDKCYKERHRNYWHMAKTLREMVEVFGLQRFDTNKIYRYLYHGVNAPLYLRSMYTKFCGTMSTSMSETVSTHFIKSDGIVLMLKTPSTRALLFGFECWRLSHYPQEEEILFFGGFSQIQVASITMKQHASEWCKYKHICEIIQALDRMFSGNPNEKKCTQITELQTLIDWQIGLKVESNQLSYYARGLFANFCRYTRYIKVNWRYLWRDFICENKLFKVKTFGYKSTRKIFVDPRVLMLKFELIQRIFPNVESILIENWWESIHYDASNNLAPELLQNILNAFQLCSGNKLKKLQIAFSFPMRKFNKTCLLSHGLKEGWISDTKDIDGSSKKHICDRCHVRIVDGQKFYGCGFFVKNNKHNCRYSICVSCFNQTNDFFLCLQDAINDKYQLLFNNISWMIKKDLYSNSKLNTSDSILFIKTNEKIVAEKVILIDNNVISQHIMKECDENSSVFVSGDDKLRLFLKDIELEKYYQTFKDEGCDTLDTLMQLATVEMLVEDFEVVEKDAQKIIQAGKSRQKL